MSLTLMAAHQGFIAALPQRDSERERERERERARERRFWLVEEDARRSAGKHKHVLVAGRRFQVVLQAKPSPRKRFATAPPNVQEI